MLRLIPRIFRCAAARTSRTATPVTARVSARRAGSDRAARSRAAAVTRRRKYFYEIFLKHYFQASTVLRVSTTASARMGPRASTRRGNASVDQVTCITRGKKTFLNIQTFSLSRINVTTLPRVTRVCPGWRGIYCDTPCPAGTWGPGCASHCDCEHGATCHHVSGACTCAAGYKGQHCEVGDKYFPWTLNIFLHTAIFPDPV